MQKPVFLFLMSVFCFLLGMIGQWLFTRVALKWDDKIDIGTVFNILSALATSIAAFAAWRSAQLAEQATTSSKTDTRMQLYVAHQEQFDRVLDEAEKEMFIGFFRRIHLYERLFPSNRSLDHGFVAKARQEVINDWIAQYRECEKLVASELPPSPEYIHDWMKKCLKLADSMNFRFRQLNEGDGEILWEGKISTWFARDGGKPFYNLGEVLYRLATFGLVEQAPPTVVNGRRNPAFFAAYDRYYEDIAQGWTPHRLS